MWKFIRLSDPHLSVSVCMPFCASFHGWTVFQTNEKKSWNVKHENSIEPIHSFLKIGISHSLHLFIFRTQCYFHNSLLSVFTMFLDTCWNLSLLEHTLTKTQAHIQLHFWKKFLLFSKKFLFWSLVQAQFYYQLISLITISLEVVIIILSLMKITVVG